MGLEIAIRLGFLFLCAGAFWVVARLGLWLQNRWDSVQGVVVGKEHIPAHEEVFSVHGQKRGTFHVPERFIVKVKGVNCFGFLVTAKVAVNTKRFSEVDLGDQVKTADLHLFNTSLN